jgi:hypothetical protein
MSNEKLLPCPFCGSPAEWEDHMEINCGCSGSPNCPGAQEWHPHDQWNTRPQESRGAEGPAPGVDLADEMEAYARRHGVSDEGDSLAILGWAARLRPPAPAPDLAIVTQEKGWHGMPVRVLVSNGAAQEWYYCHGHPMAQVAPAAPAPLVWTREKPTADGHYWRRIIFLETGKPCSVASIAGIVTIKMDNEMSDKYAWEWAGPIAAPEVTP